MRSGLGFPVRLGRNVERRRAAADPAFLVAGFADLLHHVQVDRQVELAPGGQRGVQVALRHDPVHRRPPARAEELVLEVLADDRVVAAADAEDVHPAGDLGVAQEGRPGHRIVPVSVEAPEGQISRERGRVNALHRDPAPEREGEPDQRADPVPEVVPRAELGDERVDPVVERTLGGCAGGGTRLGSRGLRSWGVPVGRIGREG